MALAEDHIDVVAADPEVPAADAGYRATIEAAGFQPIEEIQPSRHRVTLPLAGRTQDDVFAGVSKSTRQRIRKAEDLDDRRGSPRRPGRTRGPGRRVRDAQRTARARPRPVLRPPARDGGAAALHVRPPGGVRRLVDDGARGRPPGLPRGPGSGGAPLAGLILYRHGGRLSTVHSGDHAAERETTPGALHLLRWRAIELAIREGCSEMDLGGVDTAGARGEPTEGDALYGLYQHKTSFGGRWLELTGAYERVYDPSGYRLGRLADRMARTISR